ncbi:hypothetical protein, partial [Lysinibacillus sp. NPDC093688]|uniref:hypothetical protein n=1 Tax=Lysinibacillus sp. NPDC093688 TaxID=3390577 RepID=UPI003D07FE1E
QRVLFVRKRSDSNSTDVGHEGVITGCDAFSLRSSIANPRGVAQSPLQSTTPHNMYPLAWHFNFQQQQVYAKAKRWRKVGKRLDALRQESE